MRDDLQMRYVPAGRNGSGAVNLTVFSGDDLVACEKVDILRPKQRSEFIKRLLEEHPDLNGQDVEDRLVGLASEIAAPPADKPEDAEVDYLGAMPESVRAEARAMLESPDLLKTIVQDIAALGVAGEKELATTLYLGGTSRLLGKPLASIVQGPSSSGKSYLIDKTAAMFPPESVVLATQMTPQALFHMKPGSLKNRFVVAGERSRKENDDTAEATRALREMISSGRLTKLMPMKVGGEIQTVSIEQEGPIAYVESTTLMQVFDEDANRALMLTTDEQRTQTRRIISTLAQVYGGSASAGQTSPILDRHHAAQRMLQSYTVVIPFAERLGELVAPDRVEARRAFPQLASMIQASALLHQYQRKIDADGRLIAEPDDYRVARHLLLKPLGRLLGGRLSDPVSRFLVRLQEWTSASEQFTAQEVARQEKASRRSVYGWLDELHDAGWIELIEPSKGNRPATWRLSGATSEPDCAVLPTEEQVFT